MKNLKVAMVGAVAAALLLGTGCKSDQPSQEIRNQDDLGMQGTGGSGVGTSDSTSLGHDSITTVPEQNSSHQGDSTIHSQPSDVNSTGMGGSGDLDRGQQGDLSTGSANDLGTGGAGSMGSSSSSSSSTSSGSMNSTGGSGTSSGSMNSTTDSSSPSSMRGSSSKSSKTSLGNSSTGSLDNETGSRTNGTGSNISSDTNPTEPRNSAESQVPRR
jgi:trimeric autotransporter adhesin